MELAELGDGRARTEAAVILGVDTHQDTHVGVVLDEIGRRLGTLSVSANMAGYRRLLGWARDFGAVERAGVEGTGSFGAGLTRFLQTEGIEVLEVIRPKRRDQYRASKSDPIDAEAAARSILAGTTTGKPKGADGEVEMIRTLRAARRSAIKARSQAANQLKAMLVTAPEELRGKLGGLSTANMVDKAARFSGVAYPSDVAAATKLALRSVARRYQSLSGEIAELDEQLDRLVLEVASELVAIDGVRRHCMKPGEMYAKEAAKGPHIVPLSISVKSF